MRAQRSAIFKVRRGLFADTWTAVLGRDESAKFSPTILAFG
jgi:hypothetical protein